MTKCATKSLGLGIAWRQAIALDIARRSDLGFVEVLAESINPNCIPPELIALRERGVAIVPHGVSLSLGSAEPIDLARARHMAALARAFGSPLVSEHIAFVRAGGLEAGHLLPVPRTHVQLDALAANIALLKQHLNVPLALENISALFDWPDAEFTEGEFVAELLGRTDCQLLLDTSNVYANARNLNTSADNFLDALPLELLAYCHVGGGVEIDGVYHDTHSDPLDPNALAVLERLCRRIEPPGVLLERDDHFPPQAQLYQELDTIAATIAHRRESRLLEARHD